MISFYTPLVSIPNMFKLEDDFWDMYELKPEYKKKELEADIKKIEEDIAAITDLLSDLSKQLKKRKEELKALKG